MQMPALGDRWTYARGTGRGVTGTDMRAYGFLKILVGGLELPTPRVGFSVACDAFAYLTLQPLDSHESRSLDPMETAEAG